MVSLSHGIRFHDSALITLAKAVELSRLRAAFAEVDHL